MIQRANQAWNDVSEAEARLNAAAPDLLKALRELRDDACYTDHKAIKAMWAAADAAIARATGADQ